VRERARQRCESCGVGNRIVLTVAHLDHQPENVRDDNLRALCQRCHLRYDRHEHARVRREARDRHQLPIFATFAP
jgi:5-methylcytosine-specific restriction endonuclease McrA